MNTFSPAELRDKLRSELIKSGYFLCDDGTHRPDAVVDGKYHTANIEGVSHPVLVARAQFASTRFVRTFNIISETSLQRALAELGKTIQPSYMSL